MNKEPKPNSSIEELSSKELKYALQYAREDLKDIQLYLEEFSAFLPLPVISVNPLGFVLDINNALEDLTGLGKGEILGDSVEHLFVEKEKLTVLQEKVLKGQSIKGQEMTLIGKQKRVQVSVYLEPRKDEKNHITGYFIGLYDISDFKELEQSLEDKVKERTKQLRERVEELEKFRKLTEGRELKMVELKQEVKKLKEELEKQKGRE